MEYPGSWDLLTSSLAAVDLTRVGEAWAFIVAQGLVEDAAKLEAFAAIVDRVRREGPITGPSDALRIAGALRREVGVSPIADRPDPFAEIAKARLSILERWRAGETDIAANSDAANRSKRKWWPFSSPGR